MMRNSPHQRLLVLLCICVSFITYRVIAEEWYPSKYGQDDLIGAANNLDEGNVQSAAKLIDAGRVYCLAVVLNSDWPCIR